MLFVSTVSQNRDVNSDDNEELSRPELDEFRSQRFEVRRTDRRILENIFARLSLATFTRSNSGLTT